MKTMLRKALALLLCLVMCVSQLPLTAFAEEPEAEEPPVEDVQPEEAVEEPEEPAESEEPEEPEEPETPEEPEELESPGEPEDFAAADTEEGEDSTVLDSGDCSGNYGAVGWRLYDDGVLVISGEGPMADFTRSNRRPWEDYKDDILHLVVEDGVTYIGGSAFYSCTGLTDVMLPAVSLGEIGGSAFSGCSSLTNIELPNSLNTIGSSAFSNCTALESITVPENVTRLRDFTFYCCFSLAEVTLPDGLGEIDHEVFYGCTSLTTINIPTDLTYIGQWAFYQCDGLTEITLPEGLETLDDGAFNDCSNLRSVTFPESMDKIGGWAFWYCESLEEVVLPRYLRTLKEGTFNSCTSLRSVTLPQNLYNLERSVFFGCWSLESITIPASVCLIGNGVFAETAITSITIPAGVSEIGDGVFYGCIYLTEIGVEAGNAYYCTQDGALFNIDRDKLLCYPAGRGGVYAIPESVTVIGDSAFYGCSGLTGVTIPDSVTEIPGAAFYGCTGLTEITIPESVTSIRYNAFSDCTGLTEITIPAAVTFIGEFSFSGCTGLTEIAIPEGVTAIENSTFYGCTGLESVTIPASVTAVRSSAFFDCSSLTDVYYTGTEEQWTALLENIGEDNEALTEATLHLGGAVIDSGECGKDDAAVTWTLDRTGTLTVSGAGAMADFTPSGSMDEPASTPWSAHAGVITRVVIDSGVTSVGECAFYQFPNITEVSVASSVASIGGGAFYSCGALETLALALGVESIGRAAFAECESLGELTFPASLRSIDRAAFDNCSNLSSVSFENGIESIGSGAFFNCKFTQIYIPASVTEIGGMAFTGCPLMDLSVDPDNSVYCAEDCVLYNKAMTELIFCPGTRSGEFEIPEGVTTIANGAFADCQISSVTLPESLELIGPTAFQGCRLVQLSIPAGVTTIGLMAFDATEIESIEVDPGNASFCAVDNVLYSKDMTTLVYFPNRKLTDGIERSFTVPAGVKTIAMGAFADDFYLEGITLPDGLTGIGNYAFSGCDRLEELALPMGVTSVGSYAFMSCWSLSTITIPSTLTSVGRNAFYQLDSLTEIKYIGTEEQWGAFLESLPTGNDILSDVEVEFVEPTLGLHIGGENFPDSVFRSYIAEHFDDGDGYLSDAELAAVTSIFYMSEEEPIKSLAGIEHFTALTDLYLPMNGLSEANLTRNKKLRQVELSDNQLTALNVEGLSELYYLNCSNNRLTALDVSGLGKLESLYCQNNLIDTLDVSGLSRLETLYCGYNGMRVFTAEDCTELSYLHCEQNFLDTLDVSMLPDLMHLWCWGNGLTELDLTNNPGLCNAVSNGLSENYGSYVSYFTKYDDLSIEPSVRLIRNVDPDGLAIDEESFPDEALRGYVSFYFDTNRSGYLSGEEIAAAKKLDVKNRGVATLEGIELFTGLTTLLCGYNDLSELDLSANTALEVLCCEENGLSELDLTGLENLRVLWCWGNGLETLDLEPAPLLSKAYVKGVREAYNGYSSYFTEDCDLSVDNSVDVTAVFLTPWQALQQDINTGASLTLSEDVIAGEGDGPLVVPALMGVYIDLNGHTLDRGLSAASDDGSVFVVKGELRLADSSAEKTGAITGGYDANGGGGVRVERGGIFSLEGGNIVGNRTDGTGAGVFVMPGSRLSMSGGSVSGNGSGGVYVAKDAEFWLSGASEISGNTGSGGVCNLFLEDGAIINVTGELTNAEPIGVTTQRTPTADAPVIITSGLKDKGSNRNFTSDNDSFVAELNAFHETMLAVPLHITLPADTPKGTVRITDISGTPVVGEPPAYVLHNDGITLAVTPSEGYELAKGGLIISYLDGEGVTQSVEVEDVGVDSWFFSMPAADVTVTAEFTVATYAVTFDANEGEGGPAAQTKTHNVALTLSDVEPTRSESSEGFYHLIVLDGNGGTVDPSTLTAPIRTSYSFKNWNTKRDGSGTSYAPGASYTSNAPLTLYAQWEGTTVTSPVVLPEPEREGYVCIGWAASADAAEPLYEVNENFVPDGDMTLYALWRPEGLPVTRDNFPDYAFREYVSFLADSDGNGYLTDEELEAVTDINVTPMGVEDLTGIEHFANLRSLVFYENRVKKLDVSHNPLLEKLGCDLNNLGSLDVTHNPLLRELYCYGTGITELDLSQNTELEILEFGNDCINEIDLSHNPKLTTLYCGFAQLTELDLSACPSLCSLICYGNPIQTLDIRPCPLLVALVRDGLRQENGSIFWYRSDEAELSYSSDTELVTGLPALPTSIALSHDYLLLKENETKQLSAVGLDELWAGRLIWAASADGVTPGGTDIITVSDSGLVTAVKKGTAFAMATLNGADGQAAAVASCRIDVAEENTVVGSVRLVDVKVTTELYYKHYTQFQVLPQLTQSAGANSADAETAPGVGSASIESARFTEPDAAAAFDLRVVDDRTIEIVPKDEFVVGDVAKLRALKSSYKTQVTVKVDGRELTTPEALTITVRKTQPKPTGKVEKFNSFIPGQTLPVEIIGCELAKVTVKSKPDWVEIDTSDPNAVTATYTGALEKSMNDKMVLLLQPRDWEVELPITVSLSAVNTNPKLTPRPSNIGLQRGLNDSTTATFSTSIIKLADETWSVGVLSIMEGTANARSALDYTIGVDSITFREGPGAPKDNKAHTYKVTLVLLRNGQPTSVQAALSVKFTADASKVAITAKAKGDIDTGIPRSPVTITVTPKNINAATVVLTGVTVTAAKSRTDPNPVDVTDRFDAEIHDDMTVTLTQAEGAQLDKGLLYNATISSNVAGSVTVKINVKSTQANKVKASVTIKAAKYIDVVRPDSFLTVTPTVKNCFTYTPAPADLRVWKVQNKSYIDCTDRFRVTMEDGVYIVRLRQGTDVSHTDKYAVSIKATLDGVAYESSKANITLRMGTVKYEVDTKTVNLLKDDRYSRASVVFSTKDAELTDIDWEQTLRGVVLPTDKNKRPLVSVMHPGGNEIVICYANNELKSFKSATVKVPIFLKGNNSGKANATISISVKVV